MEEEQLDCDSVVYQCGACDEQFSSLEEIEQHHSADGGNMCPFMVAAVMQPQVDGSKAEVVVVSGDVIVPDEVTLAEDVDDPESIVVEALPATSHGHTCAVCGCSFSSKFLLAAHEQSHQTNEQKVHACELCKQKFSDSNEYVTHLVSSHTKKDHCCTICYKWYTSRSNLKTHMMIHAGRKPHQCDICGRQFTVSSNLKAHRRIHTGERKYVCQVCNKGFITSTHLKTHMAVHTGEKPYQCEICFREFAVNSNMRAHMLTHTGEKRHECQICGKQFATSSHVKTHLLSHTGQRDHKCPTCNKSFTVASNLKAHMKIHLGQRDHACDLCHKRFYTNSDLRIHSDAYAFFCIMCERSFAKEQHLVKHMEAHATKKNECPTCNLRCTSTNQLEIHMRTHTGERPYACSLCPRRFAKQVNLKRHMQIHTKVKFECQVCLKNYISDKTLQSHYQNCHPDFHAEADCTDATNEIHIVVNRDPSEDFIVEYEGEVESLEEDSEEAGKSEAETETQQLVMEAEVQENTAVEAV
ncbi:hypothetical protein MRX96_032809 [Rhipicephalus microplus]